MVRWRRLSWRQVLDLIRFLRDPEAGWAAKAVAWAAALYVLWPLDLLPGWPPVSWLDDATVLWLAYQVLSLQLERARARRGQRGDGFVFPGGPVGPRRDAPLGRENSRAGGGAGIVDTRGRIR